MSQKLRGNFSSKLFKYGNIKKILKWEVWAPGLGPEKVQSVISSGVITVMWSKKEIPEENSCRKIKLQVLSPIQDVTCMAIFSLNTAVHVENADVFKNLCSKLNILFLRNKRKVLAMLELHRIKDI